MADVKFTNVAAAFDILLEAVEEEIGLANRALAEVGGRGDYAAVRQSLETAERMTGMRQRVAALRDEWQGSFVRPEEIGEAEDEVARIVRHDLGRLQRGLRTPDRAFYRPILRALSDMSGSGRVGDVLDRVGVLMKGTLKDVDYEPLPSEPDDQRWRNTGQWARYQMVQEGLLKADSRRGLWEISDAGRRFLNGQES